MKQKVLLIDDDADILKVLKANLELVGFDVTAATSWTEGERLLNLTKPDILLLDIMLPDGDGIQICKTVRSLNPSMPIILLTAKDKTSDKVIGFESGADDYVVKPFETIELIARIKACIRRIQRAQDILKIRDLTIDFSKRLVMLKDKEMVLTPKEYELLCFLASQRGKVVSRADIKKNLWKESKLYSWSRVIDVHIQHLRQKLQKLAPETDYIITISGVGYKFIEE